MPWKSWNCHEKLRAVQLGKLGQFKSCRLLVFPPISFSKNPTLEVENQFKYKLSAKPIKMSEFTVDIVKNLDHLTSTNRQVFPDWYFPMNDSSRNVTLDEEQILQKLNFGVTAFDGAKITEVTLNDDQIRQQFDLGSTTTPSTTTQSTTTQSTTTRSTTSFDEKTNLDKEIMAFDETQQVELDRNKRRIYSINDREVTENQIAKFVILTSLALSKFGDNQVPTLSENAMNYGSSIVMDSLERESVAETCSLLKDGEVPSYEAKLVSQADAVIDLIYTINSQCSQNKFPEAVGIQNQQKFCQLVYPESTCIYHSQISRSFGCELLNNKWNEKEVQILMTIPVPLLDDHYKRPDNRFWFAKPNTFKPSYYHVQSMPTYFGMGYVKAETDLPRDLILTKMEDGGSRLFTGCKRNQDSESLWICNTQSNNPISVSNCVISHFNGEKASCPGKLKIKGIFVIYALS